MRLRLSRLLWCAFLVGLVCVSVEGKKGKTKKGNKNASKFKPTGKLFEEVDEAEIASQPDPVWHLQQAHVHELHGNGTVERIHQFYDQAAAILLKQMRLVLRRKPMS
eukprot:7588081-Pyramimonas_sp.AAC.1